MPSVPKNTVQDGRDAIESVLQGVRVLVLAEAIGLASGLLMHVTAAHWLDPADYGRFALMIAIEVCLVTLMTGGIPQALRQLVGVSSGNLAEAIRWSARVQLPLGISLGLLIVLGAGSVGALLGDGRITSPLRILGLDVAIRCGLMETYLALLNGCRRYTLQGCVVATFFLTRFVGVATAVALTNTPSGAVFGMMIASTVATAMAVLFVAGLRRQAPDSKDEGFAARAMKWVRLSPCYEGLILLVSAANLLLVKAITPDAESVGVYAAGFALAQSLSAVGRALSNGTFAPLTAAFSRGCTDEACRIIRRATRELTWLLVPICTIALLCGDTVIDLFYGSRYRGPTGLVGTLFMGTGGIAALAFFGSVLGAAGRLRTRLAIMAVLTPVSILVTPACIRIAGIGGASWVLLITGVAGASASAWTVRRLVGRFIPWASVAGSMVAVVPAFALAPMAGSSWQTTGHYSINIIILIYLLIIILINSFPLR
jgi:O-antigen/teichoic acid export membrane protein